MAGIKTIGQYEVTEIKKNSARVGCTKVNRTEVEALLKEMDSAGKEYENFTIENGRSNSEFINFAIRRDDIGFAAASDEVDSNRNLIPFVAKSVHFCLATKNAKLLFEFLGGVLGYDSYKSVSHGIYNILFKKV